MKTLTTILFAVLLMAGTLPAAAQHHDNQKQAPQKAKDGMMQDGMMQDGMMGRMHQMHMQMMDQAMQDPFQHSTLMVHVLPTMQLPLELSDEQVAHLEEAVEVFNRQQSALQDKASQAQSQLKDLLASDKPDPAQVKLLLRETGMLRADLKALGFETAYRMEAELSEAQWAKLSEMTPMQIHHHMAMHMTMMEMMQALQGDMMQAGMMEMMPAENMQNGMMKQ